MEPTSNQAAFSFGSSAEFKVAKSGDPEAKGAFIVRGHAAVFNRLSHDAGGFRYRIQPTFFTDILDTNPLVHLNREHDMRYLLASTKTGALELRVDPYGLHMWSKLSKTPLAEETATLMADGTLDQMSFACIIGTDEWTQDEEGNITRDLISASGLSDVALCAQGMFPQPHADLVVSRSTEGAEAFARAQAEGRIKQIGVPLGDATISVPEVAFATPTELDVAPIVEGAEQDSIAEATEPEGVSVVAARGARDLAAFKAEAALAALALDPVHPE